MSKFCSQCKKVLGNPALSCTGGTFCSLNCMDLFHGKKEGMTKKLFDKIEPFLKKGDFETAEKIMKECREEVVK